MRPRVIAAIVFGTASVAVLLGLGVWQINRLAWKETLIADVADRLAAEPVALPASPDAKQDAYLRVRIAGQAGGRAVHVLTSIKPFGPGFRVIVPFTIGDGRRILVDLGYIPEDRKNHRDLPDGRVTVTGALYWPDETDAFTPDPDRVHNIWFARDLPAMAAVLDTEPVLVIAESEGAGYWPIPRRLGSNLPNDHLQYAITWFALALVWTVMSVLLIRRELRRAK